MAKDKVTFRGKEGKWVTINGAHIFIEDGQTLEDAMQSFDTNAWETHYTNSQYATEVCSRITYADFHYHYISNGERIMPAKYARRVLRSIFEKRKFRDPDADDFVLNGLKINVFEFLINDRQTNWFKGNFLTRRLQISIGTRPEMLESISHEVGHAIDFQGFDYLSSSYQSIKYGITMQDMLFQEFPMDAELVHDEIDRLNDVMHTLDDLDENTFASQAIGDWVDMIQATHGDKVCKQIAGYLPHDENYFQSDNRNAGTELFAELTASLFTDKNRLFYNLMKQYCPKTVEIYHEIQEEVKAKWKKYSKNT